MADRRTDEEKVADPRDWRGTAIEVGASVIYGAPVGRSIELVEGEVVSFSKTGRVNVKVVRRAYQHGSTYSKKTVHVGQDRLIVINSDSLPPTTLPTWEEAIGESKRRADLRDANEATHTWPEPIMVHEPFVKGSSYWVDRQIQPPCSVCGAATRFAGCEKPCESKTAPGFNDPAYGEPMSPAF